MPRARLSRPRKSQAWAAALKTAGRPPAGCQWIYVADRESDFYEPLQSCQEHGVDFVIRAAHDRRLAEAAASFGPVLLALLAQKFGLPREGWTNRNVLVATARLGGFLARKGDGMPGWQTIWRGWQRLLRMSEGVENPRHLRTTCG